MRTATEVAVRLGALFLLVAWCLQIVAPFLGIVVWALIIAIAAAGPYQRLRVALGGRAGLAATTFVLVLLVLLFVPAVMLSETLVSGAHHFAEQLASGGLSIPVPPERVADWPIVGDRLYPLWLLASENLQAVLQRLEPQLATVSRWLLAAAGSAGIALLQLVASLLIAGVLLARSQGHEAAVVRFSSRLVGERGAEFAELAQSTVRSVVTGILGVALIQALLAGLGFIAVGLSAAGLWALLVLVAAVAQLPVVLVMIPPVLLVFSSESTGVALAFLLWSLLVSLIDNVLKPVLFGREARVPTLVIFVGTLGGMLAMGIIGLFVGAVILALGYEILRAWLAEDGVSEATDAAG
jgi:predicted PurR-regulated permease PerM